MRTTIHISEGTFTNDRDGFFFHGGTNPGSMGCIDLAGDNNSFHNWLGTQSGAINLIVDYPNYQSPYIIGVIYEV